jgi:hypothetical protein
MENVPVPFICPLYLSLMGKKSVVHYQKNPLTNELFDFKFKHHSTGLKYSEELGRYIYE